MKRVIIKLSIIIVLFFTGFSSLHAQIEHEFSLSGFGGLSCLKYDVAAGNQKSGFGGGFGAGYHLSFTPQLGVRTGLEFALFNAEYNLDGTECRYMTKDMEGSDFEFRSKASSYEETQKASLLQIPLMLQYQTGMFYVAGGVKVGIPISGKYSNTVASLKNSGYYSNEDYEYTTQQFMGFGAFNGLKSEGDLEFKTVFLLSFEAGIKYPLSGNMSLYAGAYIDYGLNNMAEKSSLQFVNYNTANPTDFAVNSVTVSQYSQSAFTDKITPMAIGVKVRLAFGK